MDSGSHEEFHFPGVLLLDAVIQSLRRHTQGLGKQLAETRSLKGTANLPHQHRGIVDQEIVTEEEH